MGKTPVIVDSGVVGCFIYHNTPKKSQHTVINVSSSQHSLLPTGQMCSIHVKSSFTCPGACCERGVVLT